MKIANIVLIAAASVSAKRCRVKYSPSPSTTATPVVDPAYPGNPSILPEVTATVKPAYPENPVTSTVIAKSTTTEVTTTAESTTAVTVTTTAEATTAVTTAAPQIVAPAVDFSNNKVHGELRLEDEITFWFNPAIESLKGKKIEKVELFNKKGSSKTFDQKGNEMKLDDKSKWYTTTQKFGKMSTDQKFYFEVKVQVAGKSGSEKYAAQAVTLKAH